jgi:pimeloyl-ACP methyl ester carboxylesterase
MSHRPALHRRLLPTIGATAALLITLAACSTPTAGAAHPTDPPTSTASAEPEAVGDEHLVDHDGHNVAFYVTPGSESTIVLDAGGGNGASYWNDLVPELAHSTGATIVTYDRTGSGKSDDVAGPFDAAAAAGDLAAGLAELPLPAGPIVLASHSLAGEIATALVNAHPGLIAGAVLIDANVPEFFTTDQIARIVASNDQQIPALEAGPQTRQTRQLLAVADGYGPTHAAYHAQTWPQNVPVNVIVSSDTPMPPGSTDAAHWRTAEQEFADAAPNRTLVTASHSSHDVAIDRPDIVETEIQDMLARVQP